MPDSLTGKTLGKYRILDKIGQGGMTSVYKAFDEDAGQFVAIKVLSPFIAQDPNFQTRFKREIQLLSRLRHPNIVPILDFGEQGFHAYIVMPFFPRGTLQDRMRESAPDPFEISRMMKQVGSALSFAHGRGVVHRDVKPSNILIGEDGEALLSDFGFALAGEFSMSLTGSAVIGTPAYMSPEQCKGSKVGARSDQYSLGVLLYQLFTGTVPFRGDTPMAVAVQHINEPVPKPRTHNPGLPQPLESVVLRSLSKKPDKRFPDIDSMVTAFQDAMQRSVDALGQYVPVVQRFDLVTWISNNTALSTLTNLWRERRPALMLGMLLIFMLPLSGFALAAVFDAGQEARVQLTGNNDPALQATIYALSTSIARQAGQGADPAVIEAAVAGTLAAEARVDSGRPTSTPGAFSTLVADGLATPTPDGGGGQLASGGEDGSGEDGSGGGDPPSPSNTPPGPTNTSPPPSATPSRTPTYTPFPTFTPPPPTSTPVPPTSTPVPPTATPGGQSGKCKENPHPVFPTCTPEP